MIRAFLSTHLVIFLGFNVFRNDSISSDNTRIATTMPNNNALRQRRGVDSRSSLTVLPWQKENGEQVTEETSIPSAESSDERSIPRPLSSRAVAKDEGRKRKIMVRIISGALMIGIFLSCTYMGHLYVCGLVALVELLLVSLMRALRKDNIICQMLSWTRR